MAKQKPNEKGQVETIVKHSDYLRDEALTNRVAEKICSATQSFDIFEDMKSEIMLAILEGKITPSLKDATSFGYSFYRKTINHKRVFLDIDTYHPDYNSFRNEGYIADHCQRERSGSKYNIRLVEPVYKLHAAGKPYREIGKVLNISVAWACMQVINTIFLPIVSTKLKNAAYKVTREHEERNWASIGKNGIKFKAGSQNINAKLNNKKVISMRQEHNNGATIAFLAQKHQISSTVANCAIKGKTWKNA